MCLMGSDYPQGWSPKRQEKIPHPSGHDGGDGMNWSDEAAAASSTSPDDGDTDTPDEQRPTSGHGRPVESPPGEHHANARITNTPVRHGKRRSF